MNRTPLPSRRQHSSFELRVPGQPSVAVGIGHYDDGKVGEVFITSRKSGSAFDCECADSAIMLSIALQHGISPEGLYANMHKTSEGEPITVVGHVLKEIISGEVVDNSKTPEGSTG